MQVELQNITAKADGLYEHEAGKTLVFVPKEDIKKLSFGFEKPSRFSTISAIFGVLLIAAGISFGVIPLFKGLASQSNNLPNLKGYALISLHILFGAYLTNLGLRKRHCLVLATVNGTQKLILSEPVKEREAAEFLHESSRQFEYPV